MRIYIHREGHVEADVVEADANAVIAEVLGVEGGEVTVSIEDGDDEIDVSLTFEQARIGDRSHVFRGRRKRVEVDVSFNAEHRERTFAPSAKVERVLKWAVGNHGFNLSKADAAEHTLTLSGDNTIPPLDAHLGSLDDPTPGRVGFKLIPKHRYEG
jgi:hypothetical protein